MLRVLKIQHAPLRNAPKLVRGSSRSKGYSFARLQYEEFARKRRMYANVPQRELFREAMESFCRDSDDELFSEPSSRRRKEAPRSRIHSNERNSYDYHDDSGRGKWDLNSVREYNSLGRKSPATYRGAQFRTVSEDGVDFSSDEEVISYENSFIKSSGAGGGAASVGSGAASVGSGVVGAAASVGHLNLDDWRMRMTRFISDGKHVEMISKDPKDRKNLDPLMALAKELGLHCQMFGKSVVISKVPLPHYRPDLDDKRPQREVSIPLLTHRRVDAFLEDHLRLRKLPTVSNSSSSSFRDPTSSSGFTESSITIMQRSNRLQEKQKEWLESEAGRKMLELRQRLPSFKERDALLQALANNQVVVISGETGCGKTTQLPQYILEEAIAAGKGGSCNIICTQPRRISAISVSERVAAERGETIGDSVGYQVRLEGLRSRNTRLLFCTTGILLRRLVNDPVLKEVTHVIVDEIHERGMNEDFLLIILKEVLTRRRDLKLVLMSATLNAELFSKFFNGAPTAHIPGFTYPVEGYFLEDILEMTGYRLNQFNQIDDYGQDKAWKMQKQYAPRKRKSNLIAFAEDAMTAHNYSGMNPSTRESLSCWNADVINFNLIQSTLLHICRHGKEGAVLVFMTGFEDISALLDKLRLDPLLGDTSKVLLLGCHGSMATQEQKLIFEHPPPGVRKIVLATNMAETSITINDVVFVVDLGKAKETSYDALNDTPCLLPTWISKASSRQRRGRAGRVKPGECFHLYPKAVHEAFAEYQLPELLRTPLHSLCLQIKSLQLGKIDVFLSKAMQPPESRAVTNAIEYLTTIGALNEHEELTDLGKVLSMLPVEPRLGKMLIMGSVFRCLDPVLTIASGLAVRDPFIMPLDKRSMADQAKMNFAGRDASDHMGIVRAFQGWEVAMNDRVGSAYCWKNFLSMQTLLGMSSMRRQFLALLKTAGFVGEDMAYCNKYSEDPAMLRAVICSGLFPGVASVIKKQKSVQLKTVEDGLVLLSQSSVNSRDMNPKYPWMMYNEKIKMSTVMVRDSTGVSDSMLLLFGGKLCPGRSPGHILMQGSYLEFFMKPPLASTVMKLREEADKLLLKKLADPSVDVYTEYKELLSAMMELLRGDACEGSFVFGRGATSTGSKAVKESSNDGSADTKGHLQSLLQKAGHAIPSYQTKTSHNQYISCVTVRGRKFVGEPAESKKQAEKNAAAMGVEWLTGLPKVQDVVSSSRTFNSSSTSSFGRPDSSSRSSNTSSSIFGRVDSSSSSSSSSFSGLSFGNMSSRR